MSNLMKTNQTTASQAVGNDCHDAIAQWEAELDFLGAFANLSQLEVHLACCPEGAPSKSYLEGYIAAWKLKM